MNKTNYRDVAIGDCLIAPPNVSDARFSKAVILIFDHDARGSMGIVINRATDHDITALTDSEEYVRIGNRLVNWGGPVHTNVVHMMHTSDWKTSKTVRVTPDLSLTSDTRMFEFVEHSAEPNLWKPFFGFCSWAPNQLEGELSGSYPWTKDQSWLILKRPTAEFLLNSDEDAMWDEALAMCSQQAISSWFFN
jgi:putative transcriptional regulator